MASTPPFEPFWKRGGFQSAEEANTAFWDNLSKVPLCRRALKEFNRRNTLVVRSATSTVRVIAKRVTRSVARSAALVKSSGIQSSSVGDPTTKLKLFARRGGPDLCDLRGYPEPAKALSTGHTMPPKKTRQKTSSTSTKSTKKTRRTSAYHPGFEQHLVNHGMYPIDYEYLDDRTLVKPANWDEIQRRLTQPRLSLSSIGFSDEAFDEFRRKARRSSDEFDVMTKAIPTIQGNNHIFSTSKKKFGNLAKLTDGNIVDAQPDIYDGARLQQLDASVREDIGSYIIPSTKARAPILPNHFTEVKGPTGTAEVAILQAMHDGVVGARAMHHLQSYGQREPIYDDNAYTISSSYSAGHLELYTIHPTAPINPGGRPEYHMNIIGAFSMTFDAKSFRQGATAYRNARDWAKEKRDEMIEFANQRARCPQDMSIETADDSQSFVSTERATTPESDTSVDEVPLSKRPRSSRPGKRVKGRPLKKIRSES